MYRGKRPSKDELKRLTAEMLQKDIAVKFGVSDSSVSRWMEELDIRKEPLLAPPKEQLEEMMGRMTGIDIAVELGVSEETISKWRKKYGITEFYYKNNDKRVVDLTGKRFGSLVVLELSPERTKSQGAKWLCQCDCGNKVVVMAQHLISGHTKTCGHDKIKDLTGRRFGKLTVVGLSDERTKRGQAKWIAKCDCGNTVIVNSWDLLGGRTRSCGCLAIHDLTGQRFGRLTVVELAPGRKSGAAIWTCKCDCGNTIDVMSGSLISGNTRSCGCLVTDWDEKSHPGWRKNITEDEREKTRKYAKYFEWRTAVYERDNYTCQYCGKTSCTLNAHHIEGYANNPELRTVVDNGCTLCHEHHMDFHHQYGNYNNNREQFNEWMQGRTWDSNKESE